MLEGPSDPDRQAFDDELAKRLRDWLDEEGLPSKKETDENAVFHYAVEYPQKGGVTLRLIRPKDRRALVSLLGIHLSQPHAQAFKQLSPGDQRELIHAIRQAAFASGDIGFNMQMDEGVPARWQFDHIVYDDAISRHTVLTGLRKVFSKHLEVVEILNRELGDRAGPGAEASTGEDVKGYL